MVSLIEDLRNHFGEAVRAIRAETAHQLVIALNSPDVRAIAGHLRTHWASRVAAVFAEDRTAAEGLFYNHYVFERAGNPCYLILEAPVPAHDPRFPSLAAELPAVNWQEREIQDWFGLEAEGHPNPRRVALQIRSARARARSAVSIAGGGTACGELAGARDSGLVRTGSGGASQSTAGGITRQLARRASAAQGFRARLSNAWNHR